MSATYTEPSRTEEREPLVSRLNLSVPVSYPSISEPTNPPPTSPQSQSSFYTNPSHTSGTATIQPPEQVATIREGSFSSAPTSGAIFSANQPERSYLQPPAWNHPRSETSQPRHSYENPPQYGENVQRNDNLLQATRLHLGELGYGDLTRRNSLDTFRILRSVVRSYDEGNLPHSVIARIELPGMWDHTRMLHNHWLQTSGTQQIANIVPSPQSQPPVPSLEVPPQITQVLTINTPPDFSQSQQVLHSTPLDTSFNAGSAAATLQSINRAPLPTTTSARETAYNPDNNPTSTFPLWAHERRESVRNTSPEVQNEARVAPQIFSPRPTPMNAQPISMTAANNHEQSTASAPLPRLLQNPANTPITYHGPQPSSNPYPPYWGYPPFPPPGFGGASPQYSNINPWNLGFPGRPMGGFQPHLGAYNIPPQFPGGYAPNWPNNPPPPTGGYHFISYNVGLSLEAHIYNA